MAHEDSYRYKAVKLFFLAVLLVSSGCENRVVPLIAAIDDDDTATIRELVAKDPSIVNAQVLSKRQGIGIGSARSNIVDRPLHYAAAKGNLIIVNLLLELGAPVNETVIRGETALHRAAARAKTDVMKALISNGAKVDSRTSAGATPLHYAAKCGCAYGRHIKLLIKHGAQKEALTKNGRTPLHWAAEWDADTAALALCAHGANIDAVDNSGKRVRDMVRKENRTKMAELLEDNGRCRRLITIYQKMGGISEPELNLAVHATNCEAGNASNCIKAGILYRDGKQVAKNEAKAVEYFTVACQKRGGLGCSLLGLLIQGGRGTPKDEGRAIAFFKQACDDGSAGGCNNLGSAYRNGKGVDQDVILARSLFEKACSGGSAIGCNNFGKMLRDGVGGPEDKNRAANLFEKACKKGVASACKHRRKLKI